MLDLKPLEDLVNADPDNDELIQFYLDLRKFTGRMTISAIEEKWPEILSEMNATFDYMDFEVSDPPSALMMVGFVLGQGYTPKEIKAEYYNALG